MTMAILTLTIDGEQVSGNDTETLLEISRQHGVNLPTLCHLDGVYDVGACRLCLVEVDGLENPVPACSTEVHDGMGELHRPARRRRARCRVRWRR